MIEKFAVFKVVIQRYKSGRRGYPPERRGRFGIQQIFTTCQTSSNCFGCALFFLRGCAGVAHAGNPCDRFRSPAESTCTTSVTTRSSGDLGSISRALDLQRRLGIHFRVIKVANIGCYLSVIGGLRRPDEVRNVPDAQGDARSQIGWDTPVRCGRFNASSASTRRLPISGATRQSPSRVWRKLVHHGGTRVRAADMDGDEGA
jgi:hypothetical protein